MNEEQPGQDATAIRAALAEAGAEAREAARREAIWKDEVVALLRQGRAAGVTMTEMAKLLGLSRQWTTHLVDCERGQVLQRVRDSYHLVQHGTSFVQTRRDPPGGETTAA